MDTLNICIYVYIYIYVYQLFCFSYALLLVKVAEAADGAWVFKAEYADMNMSMAVLIVGKLCR